MNVQLRIYTTVPEQDGFGLSFISHQQNGVNTILYIKSKLKLITIECHSVLRGRPTGPI